MTTRCVLTLLIALVCSAGAARAQEPKSPQGDETPTMTTEDVTPPSAVLAPSPDAGATLDRVWGELYENLARAGYPPEDVEQLRSLIESGQEIGFAVRFDVAPDGQIANFVAERGSGIASFDKQYLTGLVGVPLGANLGGFREVRIDVHLSKQRLRLSADGVAPSEGVAQEIEAAVQRASRSGAAPAGLMAGVSLSRRGATLSLTADVSLATILAGR